MTRMQMNGFDEIDAADLDLRADDEPAQAAAMSAAPTRDERLLPDVPERAPAIEQASFATPIAPQGSRVSKR